MRCRAAPWLQSAERARHISCPLLLRNRRSVLSLRSSAEREHPRGGSTPLSEDVCRELQSESAPRLRVRRALQVRTAATQGS